MNYYSHHIGDYLRDTAHLSVLEDGTYRRMLDLYYSSERPLPLDLIGLYRLVRAKSKEEKLAVDTVLKEFFRKGETGWHNKRADEEISKAHEKSEKARVSATHRWHSDRTVNASPSAMRTHSEGNAPNSQEPIANNQEPNRTTTAPDASRRPPKVNGHRISFNFDEGKFSGIAEEDELRWQEAFPAVPIPPAIERAGAWLRANPANRKSNYERFLVNWFSREQDRAARVK